MSTLSVGNHVQRTIAGTEFRNSRSSHFCARLQLCHRNLHQRRARIGRENVRFALDLVRNERVDWSLRFKSGMGAVPDLDTGSFGVLRKRETDGAERRSKFFVRESGNEYFPVDE